MTYRELKDAVRHLGLVESFDDRVLESCMPDATTRGLRTLSRLVPRTAIFTLAHYPQKPTGEVSSFAYTGEKITIERFGVASVCFYASSGNGSVKVRLDGVTKEIPFTATRGARTLVRIVFSETFENLTKAADHVTLEFAGESYYYVDSLSFYSSFGIIDVLPYGEYVRYDISSLVTDFGRLLSPPVRRGNELLVLNVDFSLIDSHTVALSPTLEGAFDIYYEHLPERVTDDTDEESNLDVSADLEDLLPLIVAYYVWAEDEPEKATDYYQRYTEQAALVKSRRNVTANLNYKNIDGWD